MGASILIAEDEPFIVESLNFLLTRAGHRVDAVDTGSRALQAMRGHRPDLLLLDIMLPETNGFDVLRRLRGEPELADMPVMILTAKGQEADRNRMIELGADDFVTKPFSNKDLLSRVEMLLEGGRAARGSTPSR
ncbi:response regulator [Marivibrio halodurans]|uniref:Response regulator n=1 Tax=Marivibrio halodurans TaxID=2039722 RepID=A0A8J7SP89_9PROT|nr:response regulator [Marivibrio halodurans]MBP5858483.1 response regulator [Marivibrio halodurans]